MARIVLDNCSYSYSSNSVDRALSGFTLTIEAGSFISIIGPNGCGKSTLARLLNGIIIPSEGSVKIDGMDTKDRKNIYAIRKKVAVLFQNPDNQIVGDTIEDDTAFGPENLGLEEGEITRRVESSLKSVGLLDKRKLSPNTLSGGEKARLGIAGILALSPEVLVLDEATAMLDPKGRENVMKILYALWKEQGKTIVLITHHPSETLYGERIVVMKEGGIEMEGSVEDVYKNPKKLKALGLGLPYFLEFSLLLEERGIKNDFSFHTLYKMRAKDD